MCVCDVVWSPSHLNNSNNNNNIYLLQLSCYPVAAVQYTFTHREYTEQHTETEYTERNIHSNKNTQEI